MTAVRSNERVSSKPRADRTASIRSGEARLRAALRTIACHGAQAQGDRLAVGERVATFDLERMADRVAKVELAPLAGLEGIAVDDVQLEPCCSLSHGIGRRCVVAIQRRRATPLDQLPQQGVADQARLETLGDAVSATRDRKRSRQVRVLDDEPRWPERSDAVLRRRQIDGDLATDC